MEAYDEELRVRERAVAGEDAWRRRVDQRALALDPPGWLLAELGPVPIDPTERTAWRLAAAELDGYRRLRPGPARAGEASGGRVTRDGRAGVAATRLAGERAAVADQQRERGGRGQRANRRGDLGRRPAMATDRRHQLDPERLLGGEPRRQAPGRRRDWQAARVALERLAGWDPHRDHRDLRHPNRERPAHSLSRDLGRGERDGR